MIESEFEQGTIEWHHERAGRVTGTSLKSALGSPAVQKTLMFELVAERMTEVEIVELNTPSVERGRELEPFAIAEAAKLTGENYEPCGMLICETMQDFGFSPDSVVRKDSVIVGGLETKCPNSKKHVEYLINGVIPKEYYFQVIAPFIASDNVMFWDFVSYDDRNYEKPLFHIRIERNQIEGIEIMREKLHSFLAMVAEKHESLTF